MKRAILLSAICLALAVVALPASAQSSNAYSNYWLFFGNAANPYAFQMDLWPWETTFPFGGGSFFANGPDPFSAEWGPLDAEWFWPQWRMWCLAVGDPLLVPPGPAWAYPFGWWGYPYWTLALAQRPVPPPQIVAPVAPKRYHKPPSIAKQRGGRYSPGRSHEGGFPSQGGGFSPPFTPREASFPPPMGPPPSRGGGMSHKR